MGNHFEELTQKELGLLTDKSLMPAKQRLLRKLEQPLASLSESIKTDLQNHPQLPSDILKSSPKISRGENYQLQPYRVLDYPRAFSSKNIFTFRTLVLWGHEIGFHLILGGTFREQYLESIKENLQYLPQGFFLSEQETPWIWEAEASGLIPIMPSTIPSLHTALSNRLFIKISRYISLEDYHKVPQEGMKVWQALLKCLA